MENFRKLCATLLLIFMFALPAFAGDIGCPGATGDQPPPGEMNAPPGDQPPPGGRMGDPEPPGSKGDPEPPGRMAVDFHMKYALASLIESIF